MHNVTLYRFISIANCWGANKVPFLAAAAFICQHLMKKGQTFDNAGIKINIDLSCLQQMLEVRLEFAVRVCFFFLFKLSATMENLKHFNLRHFFGILQLHTE